MSEATAAQLRELIAKGAMGSIVIHTDDARALYETLVERSVTDITQEPMEHFYGIDMGIRDPFGNASAHPPAGEAFQGQACRGGRDGLTGRAAPGGCHSPVTSGDVRDLRTSPSVFDHRTSDPPEVPDAHHDRRPASDRLRAVLRGAPARTT